MNIGIDLDNTLFKSEGIIRDVCLDVGFQIPDKYTWKFDGFPDRAKRAIYEAFNDPKYMTELEPYPFNVDTINKWKKDNHDLYIITARNDVIADETITMILRYFEPGTFKDYVFVPMHMPKREEFLKYNLDVWIDDKPEDVIAASLLGIKTYLISNKNTVYNHWILDKIKNNEYNISIVGAVSEIKFEGGAA